MLAGARTERVKQIVEKPRVAPTFDQLDKFPVASNRLLFLTFFDLGGRSVKQYIGQQLFLVGIDHFSENGRIDILSSALHEDLVLTLGRRRSLFLYRLAVCDTFTPALGCLLLPFKLLDRRQELVRPFPTCEWVLGTADEPFEQAFMAYFFLGEYPVQLLDPFFVCIKAFRA